MLGIPSRRAARWRRGSASPEKLSCCLIFPRRASGATWGAQGLRHATRDGAGFAGMPDVCRTSAGHLPDTCRTFAGHLPDIYRTFADGANLSLRLFLAHFLHRVPQEQSHRGAANKCAQDADWPLFFNCGSHFAVPDIPVISEPGRPNRRPRRDRGLICDRHPAHLAICAL